MRRVFPLFILLVGCGPSVGDVIAIRNVASLYLDEADFRGDVERTGAGADRSQDGRYTPLWDGSVVRVLARVPGGVKVLVEAAPDDSIAGRKKGLMRKDIEGITGWILDRDLAGK